MWSVNGFMHVYACLAIVTGNFGSVRNKPEKLNVYQ